MALRLKSGVNPVGIRPEILLVMFIADGIYRGHGHECVVTSLNDSVHSDTSRHYQGMAVDFRTRDFSGDVAREITEELRVALGRNYLVLNEGNHIHVSYKPRKP